MSDPFSHTLRVRYGECDPQGIVFNANYLAYFDVAMTEMWREAFGSYDSMVRRGVDMVVVAAETTFKAPARFDELVTVEARIEKLGTTSMTTLLKLRRDGELLTEGRLHYVAVDAESLAKTPIPDWLRAGLERFA